MKLYSIALTWIFSAAALACPTCKDAVQVLPPDQSASMLPAGFNSSIYVLLGTVVIAMAYLAHLIYKATATRK
jgi:hypothetical protein